MTDEYLTLQDLAGYAKLSARQLRRFLTLPPAQALPCYRAGRKILIRRSEFDVWFQQYRTRGKPALIRALRELGFDPQRLGQVRKPLAKSELLALSRPKTAHG